MLSFPYDADNIVESRDLTGYQYQGLISKNQISRQVCTYNDKSAINNNNLHCLPMALI
jgi:hypothetical protein